MNECRACTLRHSTLWPKKARFRSGRGSTGAVKVHVFFFFFEREQMSAPQEPLFIHYETYALPTLRLHI